MPAAGEGVRVALQSHVLHRLAISLMVLSGFASLVYQIVWTQQSALWLGHESAAVLAVVAGFFGGLAVGAFVLAPRVDRSAMPERWYAGCEAMIGVWGLTLAMLLAPVTAWLLDLIGAQPSPAWQWSVAFFGVFLLLLPATAAMGATLPAMERMLARAGSELAPIATLYAANTFGAVIGVLAAAFMLVPQYGLRMTASVCAVLNLLCALAAILFFAKPRNAASAVGASATAGPGTHPLLLVLTATGLLGIGYEVLVIRVLSQVAENTVYTFAILLAVYLVGTALGAALYGRWLSIRYASERLRDHLLHGLAIACLLGILALAGAETVKSWALNAFGASFAAALAAEAALAVAGFLLPALLMGALFSHLATTARTSGITFGRALGVNTVGAATAPLLFGVLVVPMIGAKVALLLVAAGYLGLSSARAWSSLAKWGAIAATLAVSAWGPSLAIVAIPQGGRLVHYTEGTMATVSVVTDASGVASLHINNRQQEGSSATLYADSRQALLPILLHPAPRRALFLGLGTGVTAWSAAGDARLEVDAVELLPEVIEASGFFTRLPGDQGHNPRLHLMTGDARRFVRTTRARYDVIVSDNFHPARSGSGSLYTVEHFEAVRGRLAPGGLFCQWLPLHQMDLDTLRSIVRAFLEAYPHGWAMLATNSLDTPVVGLLARERGEGFDVEQVRLRLASAAMSPHPAELGVADDFALLGSFIAGPSSLVRFAGDAPLNTDDHPVVMYRAPRITYVPDSQPRDRLIALLRALAIAPEELLVAAHDGNWDTRLAAYWAARNRFIEVGRNVRPAADVRRMLAQVREPLLGVLHISADFRPAYDPLLQMASALGQIDVPAARELLNELKAVQPSRPEAAQVLRDLPSD